MPNVPWMGASEAATFLKEAESMADGTTPRKKKKTTTGKLKGKPKDMDEEPTQVLVLEPIDRAQEIADKAQAQAAQAYKYAVALSSLQFSSEMVDFMKQHAKSMSSIFKKLQKKIMAKDNSDSAYAALFAETEERMDAYDLRKKLATSMANAVRKKKEHAPREEPNA